MISLNEFKESIRAHGQDDTQTYSICPFARRKKNNKKTPESPHFAQSWKLSDRNPIILYALPFLAEHYIAETQGKQDDE